MSPALEPIKIVFEGNDADRHLISAGALADSLHGISRLMSNSVFLLDQNKVPTSRQTPYIRPLVEAPKAGSIEILLHPETLAWALPLLYEPFIGNSAELLWRTISYIILRNSGQKEEANVISEPVIDYLKYRDEIDSKRLTEERQFTERREERLMKLANVSRTATANMVTPIGQTAERLIFPYRYNQTVLDVEKATIIRIKAEEGLGELTEYNVMVDGVTVHTEKLSLIVEEFPDRFIKADVKDKSIHEPDNLYTAVLGKGIQIAISARPIMKDGEVVRLEVYSAKPL